METKRCSSCWQRLPPNQFWLKHRNGWRLQEWCKGCMRAWRYSYREIERDQERHRRALKKTSGGPPAQVVGEIADAIAATSE